MDIPKNPTAPAPPADKLPSLSDLDKLIAESEEALKRLDTLQRRDLPLTQRLRRHLHKNSPHLINVLLAGTVLVVAMGRLQQKHEHQAEKAELEAAQRKLEAQKAAVEQRARAVAAGSEALVAGLEAATEGRGRKDLHDVVRQQLADWRARVGGASAALAAGAPPPAAGAQSGGGADGSSGEASGSKIMI